MTATRSGALMRGTRSAPRPTIGDAGLVGGREHRVAVEHERLARVDRQRGRAGDAHRLDRGEADDRHVEAHVLLRLGHLDDAHARARRGARRGAMTSSVPSIASTATTAWCFTAIVCPMSRPAMASAMR